MAFLTGFCRRSREAGRKRSHDFGYSHEVRCEPGLRCTDRRTCRCASSWAGRCRHGLISLACVVMVAVFLPFAAAFAEGTTALSGSERAKSSMTDTVGLSGSEAGLFAASEAGSETVLLTEALSASKAGLLTATASGSEAGLSLEAANINAAIKIRQNGLRQPNDLLAEPELVKVNRTERSDFQRRFRNVQWTGAGFEGSTVIDRLPTRELRARLQKVYGDPSQKLKDLIDGNNFRPGHYIQFEYWFVINDEIPMMVLDIDGPFGNGLVFAGDSRFVDLMPEIKRTLSAKLMEITELAEYEDHYYDINKRQWYLVRYMDGAFSSEEVMRPRILK